MKARFKEIHEWIVAGEIGLAKRALLEISKSKSNADHPNGMDETVMLASLYRRVDLNSQALRVLAPLVIGRGRVLPTVNPNAKLEYADCLKNLGLLSEARKILLSPELNPIPRAKFILGLSYLHDYELPKAEEVLSELYHHKVVDFSHYQIQIIGVNLLIAKIWDLKTQERKKSFLRYFEEIQNECFIQNYTLLLGHLTVIKLQFKVLSHSISEGDLKESEEFSKLPDFSRKTAELYLILTQYSLKKIRRSAFLKLLRRLREECIGLRLFEVMREIDFHQGTFTQDQNLLQKVYEHSVNQSYRKKINIEKLPLRQFQNGRFIMGEGESDSKKGIELNLEILKNEPLLVQLMKLMCQEQYLPLSIHFIWNELVPDQHFIEPSSRQSIHQWIKRLRDFLVTHHIPLNISFDETGYRLVAKPHQWVRINWPEAWSEGLMQKQSLNYLFFIEKVQKLMISKSNFKLCEVMEVFPGVSRRTIQFFLLQALKENAIIKSGKNKGTIYQLNSN